MKPFFLTWILISISNLTSFAQQSTATFAELRSQVVALDKQIGEERKTIDNLRVAIKAQEEGPLKKARSLLEPQDKEIQDPINDIQILTDEILRIQQQFTEDYINDPRLQSEIKGKKNPKYDPKYDEERGHHYSIMRNEAYRVRDAANNRLNKIYDKYKNIYDKSIKPELNKLDQLQEQLEETLNRVSELSAQRIQLWLTAFIQFRPAYIQSVSLWLPHAGSMPQSILYEANLETDPRNYWKEIADFDKAINSFRLAKKNLRKSLVLAGNELKAAQDKWDAKNKEYISQYSNGTDSYFAGLFQREFLLATLTELADAGIAIGSAAATGGWAALPVVVLNELAWRGYEAKYEKPDMSIFPSLPESFIVLRDELSRIGPGSGVKDMIKEKARQIRQGPLWGVLPPSDVNKERVRVKELNDLGVKSIREFAEDDSWSELGKEQKWEFMKGLSGVYLDKLHMVMRTEEIEHITHDVTKYLSRPASSVGGMFLQSISKAIEEQGPEFLKSFIVTAAKYGAKVWLSKSQKIFYELAMLDLTWFVRRYELYEKRVALQLMDAIEDNEILWLGESLLKLKPTANLTRKIVDSEYDVLVLGDDEIKQGILLDFDLSKYTEDIQFRVVWDNSEKKFLSRYEAEYKKKEQHEIIPQSSLQEKDSGMMYVQFYCPKPQTFDPTPGTVAILTNIFEWQGLEEGIDSYHMYVIRASVKVPEELAPNSSFFASVIAPLSDRKNGRGMITLRILTGTDDKILLQKQYITSIGDGHAVKQEILAPGVLGTYIIQLYNEDRQQVLAADTFKVINPRLVNTGPPDKYCNMTLTGFFNEGVRWGKFLYTFPYFEDETKSVEAFRLLDEFDDEGMLTGCLKDNYKKYFFESIKKMPGLPFDERKEEFMEHYSTLLKQILESGITCDQGLSGTALFYAGKKLGEIYSSCQGRINEHLNFEKVSKDYLLGQLKELKSELETLRPCLPTMDITVLDMKTIPDDPNAVLTSLKEKLKIDFGRSICCCRCPKEKSPPRIRNVFFPSQPIFGKTLQTAPPNDIMIWWDGDLTFPIKISFYNVEAQEKGDYHPGLTIFEKYRNPIEIKDFYRFWMEGNIDHGIKVKYALSIEEISTGLKLEPYILNLMIVPW